MHLSIRWRPYAPGRCSIDAGVVWQRVTHKRWYGFMLSLGFASLEFILSEAAMSNVPGPLPPFELREPKAGVVMVHFLL